MVQTRAMKAGAAAEKATKSYLLGLPPELRARIYEYVVHRCDPVEKSWDPDDDGKGVFINTKHLGLTMYRFPALLLTCRQIRSEALPVYFNINNFTCGATCPRSMPKADPIHFGVLTKHVHKMKVIEIVVCVGKGHYLLDLTKGLAKYELKMVGCRDWNDMSPGCNVNESTLEQSRKLLDEMKAKAKAADEVLVIDEERLRAVIQLIQTAK